MSTMDVHSRAQRSRNMSAIRSKGTKPELAVRSALYALGYRFRINVRGIPGTPDLVFTKRKTALFVNGCFWHAHDCKWGSVLPATNAEFWASKRQATVSRDARNELELQRLGWTTITLWECQIKTGSQAIGSIVSLLGPPKVPKGRRSRIDQVNLAGASDLDG